MAGRTLLKNICGRGLDFGYRLGAVFQLEIGVTEVQ